MRTINYIKERRIYFLKKIFFLLLIISYRYSKNYTRSDANQSASDKIFRNSEQIRSIYAYLRVYLYYASLFYVEEEIYYHNLK